LLLDRFTTLLRRGVGREDLRVLRVELRDGCSVSLGHRLLELLVSRRDSRLRASIGGLRDERNGTHQQRQHGTAHGGPPRLDDGRQSTTLAGTGVETVAVQGPCPAAFPCSPPPPAAPRSSSPTS